ASGSSPPFRTSLPQSTAVQLPCCQRTLILLPVTTNAVATVLPVAEDSRKPRGFFFSMHTGRVPNSLLTLAIAFVVWSCGSSTVTAPEAQDASLTEVNQFVGTARSAVVNGVPSGGA